MTNRVISSRLYVDWNFDGSYTLEPSLLISARGDMRMSPPEDAINSGRGMIDSATLTLRNADGLLSPLRTDGAYYSLIRDGKMFHAPCYLEVSINGGIDYYRLITGILKLPRESALTFRSGATVTIEIRSDEERLLQQRTSTALATFAGWHDDSDTEADIIQDVLVDLLDLTLPGDAARIDIEPGIFTIPYAWLDDESAVEFLWKLASSAGGRYYADPDGVHRYESFTHWVTSNRSTEVQARYTKDDYTRLDAWYDDRNIYSEIVVETSPLRPEYASVAWQIDAPLLVYPGTTEKVTAELDDPIYEIDEVTWTARSLGGTNVSSSISVTQTDYAQRIEFEITNSGSLLAAVTKLTVTGRSIVADAAQSVKRTAADDGTNGAFFTTRLLTRTRKISGRKMIQTLPHAQTLAQYLLDRCEKPRLTFRLVDCPGNPELRVGDRIHIADNDWLHQDGAASNSAWIIDDSPLVISADLTIAYAPLIIAAGVIVTVTETGEWTIGSGDVTTVTEITENLTIDGERNDTSGQVRTDGTVLINAGVTVTVLGLWIIEEEGVYAYVTGISWTLANTYRQTIDAIAVDGMFAYDGSYFFLDTDIVGGSKVIFY